MFQAGKLAIVVQTSFTFVRPAEIPIAGVHRHPIYAWVEQREAESLDENGSFH
jgi:hypothetical protein